MNFLLGFVYLAYIYQSILFSLTPYLFSVNFFLTLVFPYGVKAEGSARLLKEGIMNFLLGFVYLVYIYQSISFSLTAYLFSVNFFLTLVFPYRVKAEGSARFFKGRYYEFSFGVCLSCLHLSVYLFFFNGVFIFC